MMTEQIFKNILDMSWKSITTSTGLINVLEYIGLNVNDSKIDRTYMATPDIIGFHSLYELQDKASMTILDVLDIDHDMPCKSGNGTVLEELDQFMADTFNDYFDHETFPKDAYDGLIELLACHVDKLPWEDVKTDESDLKDIGNAYWDEGHFGKLDAKSPKDLKSEGYSRYEVTVTQTGGITVWAHNEHEATDVVNKIPSNEITRHATFDGAYATDAYGCDED